MAGWQGRRTALDEALVYIATEQPSVPAGELLSWITAQERIGTPTARTYILELEAAGHVTITGNGRNFKDRTVKITKKGLAYLTGLNKDGNPE